MVKKTFNPFSSAQKEAHHSVPPSPQSTASAYRLAFTDTEFLLRQELRPIRLQLELMKPELTQQDLGIHSTIVVFGSARIPEPQAARDRLAQAQKKLNLHPQDIEAQFQVNVAHRMLENSHYYEQARLFSKIVSQHAKNHPNQEPVIVTGGGPGIMEAANRGAFDERAKSMGFNIVLPMEQGPNPYITPELCFQFHYFAIRKMHFLIRARALVAFPGGYGTMDELFEALTLIQTKKIEPLPILLFGEEFWRKAINFDFLIEEGMINPEDVQLFQYVEDAETAWNVISRFFTDL